MTVPSRGTSVNLRIPAELWRRIKALAELERRSATAEGEVLLDQAVTRREREFGEAGEKA